jgi:hypothetical protein
MNDLRCIRDYLVSQIENMNWDSSSGMNLEFPNYELTPYDYLDYALPLCKDDSISSFISCVGHLKRAVDCQLDTFLHVVGLSKIFAKANLKFEKKLKAIAFSGMFHSNALANLNNKRNDLEHRYSVPDLEDLQVYYELVFGFVEVLEAHMIMLRVFAESFWVIHDETGKASDSFTVQLESGVLKFETGSTSLEIKPYDEASVKQFLIGLNILFILVRANGMDSKERTIQKLKALEV